MKGIQIEVRPTIRTANIQRFLTEIDKYPVLSREEELEAAIRKDAGHKDALDKLVTHNLRFAVSSAKQWCNNPRYFHDFLSVATDGIIEAAEKFDHTKGFKFISYAVWWVQQRMMDYVYNKKDEIRLPGNVQSKRSKINKFIDSYYTKFEFMPSADEIATHFELKPDDVRRFLGYNVHMMSNGTANDDDEYFTPVLDKISDTELESPEERFEEHKHAVSTLLSTLNRSDRQLMELLYDFDRKYDGKYSADRAVEALGLTKSMINLRHRKILDRIGDQIHTKNLSWVKKVSR
jgi:RNA polymerase primary sigma factor